MKIITNKEWSKISSMIYWADRATDLICRQSELIKRQQARIKVLESAIDKQITIDELLDFPNSKERRI